MIASGTGVSIATARYAFLAAVVLLSGVFCFGSFGERGGW